MGTSRPGQYGNKQDSFFSPHPKHFQEKRFNNTRISRSGSLMLVKWTLFLGAPANRLLLLFNTNQLGVSLFFPRKTHFLPLISLKYVITITRWIYTTSFIYSIDDDAVFFYQPWYIILLRESFVKIGKIRPQHVTDCIPLKILTTTGSRAPLLLPQVFWIFRACREI